MNNSDKLCMPLSEFNKMSCESFNQWRRTYDFPRIFDFLVEALPNFLDWLKDQKNIEKSDLIYHGPAKFIRVYGYDVSILHVDTSFHSSRKHINHLFINSSDSNVKKVNVVREQRFVSYFDWLLASDFKERLDVFSMFAPSGRTSSERNENTDANISLNIPLHMPSARTIEDVIRLNKSVKIPRLELLKIYDDGKLMDDCFFLEKNLDFMNFNGLTLRNVCITNGNDIHYSTFDEVSFIGAGFSHIIFYTCLFKRLNFTDCSLYKCDFLHGDTNMQFIASKLRECKLVSNSMKIELERTDIYEVGFIWDEIKAETTGNRVDFHHACKLIYSRQGYPDLAGEHYYLERVSRRKDYLSPKGFLDKNYVGWLFDRIHGAYWGYGEKPMNIIGFCSAIILLVSFFNYFTCDSSTHGDVLYSMLISCQAFTNIKIVELSQTSRILNGMLVALSFLGVFSLGFLISSLSVKARKYN
ncbi:hypothetical protein [Aeromonas veronii]|uniref:hypothetical protein n=1 Tax=Aeromonas veronii TaxID=654 RepID=UPI003BA2DAD6